MESLPPRLFIISQCQCGKVFRTLADKPQETCFTCRTEAQRTRGRLLRAADAPKLHVVPDPTAALPGSPQKVEVLRQRVSQRIPVFSDADARWSME